MQQSCQKNKWLFWVFFGISDWIVVPKKRIEKRRETWTNGTQSTSTCGLIDYVRDIFPCALKATHSNLNTPGRL